MKIIIVGTAYPLRGGIAHFNALLAEHLAQTHSVGTITFKRQYPKIFFPGTTQEEAGESHPAEPAPQMVDSINPLNWLGVGRYISRLKPDLLIFKYWMPFFAPCFGTIARVVKKRTGAKVLFICDNIIPHEHRPGDLLLTRYAFKTVDCFIVQSDAVERDLQKLFPRASYRKVAHPVYENFGKPIPREEARRMLRISSENVILFFGYVRPYKGLMILLEALAILRDRMAGSGSGPMPLLLAVGEYYDDEAKYRARARELNVESHIRFVSEYVPNDAVGQYFSAADAVILPYRSATQSGIAQIAYNFDKPVIATNVGGLAEVVIDGRTGYVVPPDDPASLAGAIARFFEQRKGEDFSGAVKIEKRKYGWENLTRAIDELVG